MNLADYTDWSKAYQFLNHHLFYGELPEVAFTMVRKANCRGYAGRDYFAERDGLTRLHELAMNPDFFLNRDADAVLSTLAHEMCHVWQYAHGKTSRMGYHNKEWGSKMEEIGLMPSSTGEPGGKRTGQKMTHYIVTGGPFETACKGLLADGWAIRRGSGGLGEAAAAKKKDPSKVKFTCMGCGQNAWAKETASLVCGECDERMMAGSDEC